MASAVYFWKRLDLDGFERLQLKVGPGGMAASSTVISTEAGGFRLDHRWQLGRDWSARSVTVDRWGASGHGRLQVERAGGGWRIDGKPRPDLDGAEEPDLSVTPFCNSFPIYRLPQEIGATLTLDTVYIDGAALTVARSRQSYVRQARDRARYIDSGTAAGFEADLRFDDDGVLLHYEHLFERVGVDGP